MNKFFMFSLSAIIFLALNSNVQSAQLDIDMLNKRSDGEKMVYSQDVIYIKSNDTINWLPTSPGHNVEFIAYPYKADVPQKPSKVGKEFSFTFTDPGIYLYQCSPHKSMGMIAIVVVDDDKSNLNQVASTKVVGKSKKKLEQLISGL